ncbi:MAG: hypothetical protein HYU67_14115 [Flavobacteriia bacterium]|nr:hypothetical protein [Flavobacteriia bacterium]
MIAQDEENELNNEFKQILPKHSYSIDLTLPTSHKNKTFKGVMQGLCRLNVNYNYYFVKKFATGLGYTYTFFQINRFKTPKNVVGGIHFHSYYTEIGYKNFFNERFGLELNLKLGQSSILMYSDSLSNVQTKKYNNKNANYFEPSLALVLTSGSNSSLKWIFGYNIQYADFKLKDIGILSKSNYPENDQKRIQFLYFGFSFCHYFKERN